MATNKRARLLRQPDDYLALQEKARRKLGVSWNTFAAEAAQAAARKVCKTPMPVSRAVLSALPVGTKVWLMGEHEIECTIEHQTDKGTFVQDADGEAYRVPSEEWQVLV